MNRGFTLIETLIYSGVVTIFLTFALLMTYGIIDSSDNSLALIELSENQRFLTQKIGWVLSNVSAVNSPSLGSSGSSLSVNKLDAPINPFVISSFNNQVNFASGTAEAVPLSNSRIAVTNLNFSHFDFSGKNAIRVTANLGNNASSTTIDSTFLIK